MAVIRICAEEVFSTTATTGAETITCNNPEHVPVGPGTQATLAVYNVALDLLAIPPQVCFSYDAQLEYQYLNHGITFLEFCHVNGNSTCLDLPTGLGLCTCGITPTISDTSSIAVTGATPTSVSGQFQVDFTVSDLCIPTSFCIDTTDCITPP